MKVYQIKPDFSFQSFFPYDPSIDGSGEKLVQTDISLGRGVRKLSTWTKPPIFVDKPHNMRGNFSHVWGFGDFAVDAKACQILEPIFEKTCELLPFQMLGGKEYFRLNLLNTVDCLDQNRTKWRARPNGAPSSQIEEFQFDPCKFDRQTLFKLPKRVGLLTVSGLGGIDPEFKTLVEKEGLSGLIFKEIWSLTPAD